MRDHYDPTLDVDISLVGRRDLAGEIYRQLRTAILEGRLQGGEALPPTRDLASRLGVCRATAVTAYERLIEEGFATATVGSGTYVQAGAAGRARPRRGGSVLRPQQRWRSVPPLPASLWQPAEFDFRPGVPDAQLFPYHDWRRLLAKAFRPGAVEAGYGRPAGHLGLRAAIARHVGTARGVHAEADDVIVTNGMQQAIDLIARVLLRAGDTVAVEDPGYTPPRRLLTSLGLRVVPVPIDSEGLRIDAIPATTRLVCVSPSHQFPLGMTMSLRRRLALLEWAHRHRAAIMEDDYDSEFRFGDRPIEPLQLLDTEGRVLYVGSFSKTMLPALRMGFVVAPASLSAALEAAKYVTDWHAPLHTQAALAQFLADGLFARHVRRMRAVYRERHHRMLECLARHLGDVIDVIPSSVGFHLAALAPRFSVAEIRSTVERAAAVGVACQPLSMYTVGSPPRPGIVLGYGAIDADEIDEGLRRLRDCFPGSTGKTARPTGSSVPAASPGRQ